MIKILGLDLGPNSIGWAIVQRDEETSNGRILGAGSRIIPMDQAMLGDFERGNKVSQTAERTRLRGVRRLYERSALRRERLHRVLNILGFLPEHYAREIDFNIRLGQFINHAEPKIAYVRNDEGKYDFLFKTSFDEMLGDFKRTHPELVRDGKKVPYNWTIYYLRKKAISRKIEKEELAWILLNFNQKRGYYQLRGEEEEEKNGKLVEFHSLMVTEVVDTGEKRGNNICVKLENGWAYRRQSRMPLDWVGKVKDFIVTTDIDENGRVKKNKYGEEMRSFRAPSEDDWRLVKIKTEKEIEASDKTVGCYIYDTILNDPLQKIRGKQVNTIERKFYKEELRKILETQKEFHPELSDPALFRACIEELYPHNENHRGSIGNRDMAYLLIDDILFYQRSLKSQKSTISSCRFEFRYYKDKEGLLQKQPVKCISKSHPLYQEFRLWKFLSDLRIYKRIGEVNGKPEVDIDVTDKLLPAEEDKVELFEWLMSRKEIKQDAFLKYPKFNLKKETSNYRWNYVEDKTYPCNETHASISSRLKKAGVESLAFEDELELWHILYSVSDRQELVKALSGFTIKKNLPEEFVEAFRKFPPFESDYGAYSEKAVRKLLSLMRLGKYWKEDAIDTETKKRIDKLIDGEYDENINERVREKASGMTVIDQFRGLPEWLASYIIYGRHAEAGDLLKWESPEDIEYYLKNEFRQHSLRNPIVEQMLTETLRVVKDIWVEFGHGEKGFFDEIHLELGRDIKKTADERKRLSETVTRNENTNLRIRALLEELHQSGMAENVRPYSPMQQELLKIYEEGVLTSCVEIPDDITKISRTAQPTKSEMQRYRLWLEQKYCSPYTGRVIPLGKLFTTDYNIEHVIPRARFFDDSLSNKVICETAVNREKGSMLGYEFIKSNEGRIIELGFGDPVRVFSLPEYEAFVRKTFAGNKAKMKKLLLEDIPEEFAARQMNDTRYISREIQRLLAAIVRDENDQEVVPQNKIISCNGTITTELKRHWGMNDVWNDIVSPRFERLNRLTNSSDYGEWTTKNGKRVFQTRVPFDIARGFNKKRIDHRHHEMDAIVIACATRDHVNYLNNKEAKTPTIRYDLRSKLCEKRRLNENGKEEWAFRKPWETFTQDTKEVLLFTIVSFKQNLRVINRTVNHFRRWEKDENGACHKVWVTQVKGDAWAIRKPMHKETVSGKIELRIRKEVRLSVALGCWENLVDKPLKSHIKELIRQYGRFDKSLISKYFKDRDYQFNGKDIWKVEIYSFVENAASRVKLDDTFDRKKIESVTDTGIRKILLNHLEKYEDQADADILPCKMAFSPDGIEEMNKNILELNSGRFHKPVYRVRTFEPVGNKFPVGTVGNKASKYVEAAKGTNLFFAIYQDENGKKSYETIPLNVVIERQKQGENPVPETKLIGDVELKFVCSLSPNDLVYVPTQDELESGNIDWSDKQKIAERTYKMVSSSGPQCFFIPAYISSPIIQTKELGANNKAEKSWDGIMIKEVSIRLKVNRLGIL